MPTTDRKFAQGTAVPVDKTLEDLKTYLRRYGITQIGNMETDGILILFKITAQSGETRNIRFAAPLPDVKEFQRAKINQTGATRARSTAEIEKLAESERRRIYRALALIIKARLLAKDEGIQTLEEVFLPETVVGPQGETVFEMVNERVAQGYIEGSMPDLLPALPPKRAVFRAITAKEEGQS